jgi:hypothetical protein
MNRGSECGVALIAALIAMTILSALALSLTTVTSTEERVSSHYAGGNETLYAAEAVLTLAIRDLAAVPDWSAALDGSATSSLVDLAVHSGPWPDGIAATAAEATARITCGKPACNAADMDARTAERPWGADNPRWQLYAYGPASRLSSAGAVHSHQYVAVWVGDDPSETDGKPLVDGDTSSGVNPGWGKITLLAHGYGPSGVRRVVIATIERRGSGTRVLSWQTQ